MSAVSNRVMPRSIALWITLRELSRSVRWPKLLQPRPTAETRRPEPPRLRICMDRSCGKKAREEGRHCGSRDFNPQGAELPRRQRHGRYLGGKLGKNLGRHTAQKSAAPVRRGD